MKLRIKVIPPFFYKNTGAITDVAHLRRQVDGCSCHDISTWDS